MNDPDEGKKKTVQFINSELLELPVSLNGNLASLSEISANALPWLSVHFKVESEGEKQENLLYLLQSGRFSQGKQLKCSGYFYNST